MHNSNLADKEFLTHINEVVNKNLNNEHFGVSWLAKELGMSRSNLHRKVHSVANVSASQFIRNVRLDKAKELLKTTTSSISEVAYNVGFSNPSYFSKCFHDYTGYSPGQFGTNSKSSNEEGKIKGLNKNKKAKVIFILGGFIVILILSFAYFYYPWQEFIRNRIGNNFNSDKSIAVLPFVYLGEQDENLYFAEGVTESILDKLIQIKGLRVVAINLTGQLKENQLSTQKIAREYNANYFLTGSVQHLGIKALVVVKLTDTKLNQIIWSDTYDREISDLFFIQSDIAKQVAANLETVISPTEIQQIDKIPTENIEAHSYFLKGRYFLNVRTSDGLAKSRENFERAIAADDSYAEAYAGLANSYLIATIYQRYPRPDGYTKAKELANKALELDYNLAEAHACLGALLYYGEWKWEEARAEFQLAIGQNPNSAMTHYYYANLLYILQEYDQARKHINLASKLNPTSLQILTTSVAIYCVQDEFEQALDECTKVAELYPESLSVYWHFFHLYIMLGEEMEAVKALEKALSFENEDIKYANRVLSVYNNSGMPGVYKMLIDYEAEDIEHGIIGMARDYALLGEKEKAMDTLEKAMEMQVPFLPILFGNYDFKILRDEPRFKELINKLGLSSYYNTVASKD